MSCGGHRSRTPVHPPDPVEPPRAYPFGVRWRRIHPDPLLDVLTDPVTATVLDVDRYSPLAAQRRFLASRDIRCRCPGCLGPARAGQIDHSLEHHEGGPTALGDLAHLCVRHHTLKTETDWTVRQHPGGRLEWTSPLGHTARDEPPPRVVFFPGPDPVSPPRPPF